MRKPKENVKEIAKPSKQLIKEKTAAAMVVGLDPLTYFEVWKAATLVNEANLVALGTSGSSDMSEQQSSADSAQRWAHLSSTGLRHSDPSLCRSGSAITGGERRYHGMGMQRKKARDGRRQQSLRLRLARMRMRSTSQQSVGSDR
jgi:hypothetical protein